MYGHANKACCCCYTWVQMLLQIGPLLRLGSNCYYRWDFYYAWVQCYYGWDPYYTWVQLLHLCLQQGSFNYPGGLKVIHRTAQTAFVRGTQREYSSKPLKHNIVKRILEFKR